MTKLRLITLHFCLFMLFSILAKADSRINFKQISFSQAKSEASVNQKHFIAYFYADYCVSCRIMNETTFTDQKLTQFINDEFLAVKVDIQSALGKDWDKEFQITSMPTFLVFDENGLLVQREENSVSGSLLYQILKESQDQASEVVVAAFFSDNDLESLAPSFIKSQKITVKKMLTDGTYKLQIAKYHSYDRATQVKEYLSSYFIGKDMFIIIDKKGNYKTYEILIKGFQDQEDAAYFLEVMKGLGFKF